MRLGVLLAEGNVVTPVRVRALFTEADNRLRDLALPGPKSACTDEARVQTNGGLLSPEKVGAGDANRTRDPNLGKVMLYP